MAINIETVGGQLLGKERGRVVSFGPGRVCEAEGCQTRLSIYNSRPRCALHDFDISLVQFRSPSPEPADGDLHRHGHGHGHERQAATGTHRIAGASRPRRRRAA